MTLHVHSGTDASHFMLNHQTNPGAEDAESSRMDIHYDRLRCQGFFGALIVFSRFFVALERSNVK